MVRTGAVTAAILLSASVLTAQELEPGLYQNAPVGLNVAIAGVVFSTGNVLVDSSVPIEDGRARITVLGLGYVRTLRLFDHLAKFDAQLPLAWSHFTGVVNGENRVRDPNGLADPRVRLSVNLFGSPALDLPDFGRYRQRTIVGVGLQVALPLGQYDRDRLVNLGSNRWSFRPEIGVSQAVGRGRLVIEVASGAWLFTKNDDYFGGRTLEQRALYFVKVNGIYAIRRGVWTSLSYGRANGGETLVNGALANSLQRNDRVSAVFAFPVPRRGGIKITYVNGLSTRLGADFDSIGVAYQYTWRGNPFGR